MQGKLFSTSLPTLLPSDRYNKTPVLMAETMHYYYMIKYLHE